MENTGGPGLTMMDLSPVLSFKIFSIHLADLFLCFQVIRIILNQDTGLRLLHYSHYQTFLKVKKLKIDLDHASKLSTLLTWAALGPHPIIFLR